MKHFFTLILFALVYSIPIKAQEIQEFSLIDDRPLRLLITPMPPPAPVRTMAEWEEVQAVLISWKNYPIIMKEIVRYSVEECRVVIFAQYPESVADYLVSEGISLDNVTILSDPFNSVWIRDYGPWTIYHNDVDSLMLVDWKYNRPFRVLDDQIPAVVAAHFDLPLYEAVEEPYRWVHAGGNHLRDGMGTNFSSTLVLDENEDKTEEELDEIANLFLGTDKYIKLPSLQYDSNHHVDMHMRLIDEETIIVGEYPSGVADGPQIEENLEYIQNEVVTYFGNEYRIIRIPMPPSEDGEYPDEDYIFRTYTNALFVNKTILVPVYGLPMDSLALDIYQTALPGYKVAGIDCTSMIDEYGAIHCITKLVGANEPLWIAHARLRDSEIELEEFPVEAIIKHKSGIAEAKLHYRLEGEESYNIIPMVLVDSVEAMWSAAIPMQTLGSVVEYYIYAQANNGKEQRRPMVAPEGFFRFRIGVLDSYKDHSFLPGLEVRLTPNPATDVVNLHFDSSIARELEIILGNAQGQQSFLQKQYLPQGESHIELPVSHLADGAYMFIFKEGQRHITQKLIITHQ